METVERALELHGAPVYVRRQIVHNLHVVNELEARGAVFVDSEDDVPEGSLLVLSAHGVAPAVHERARRRGLRTIDATCPLVAKVHAEARRYAAAGYTIVLVGHAGHEEVEGTLGEAPEATVLVETVEGAEQVRVQDPGRVAYVTQTTLSVDETAIEEHWLDGAETVGLASGASAPEDLVRRVCAWFRARGVEEIRAAGSVVENVFFRLPVEVRPALPAA